MGRRYITQEALQEKGGRKKEKEGRDKKKDGHSSYHLQKLS